MSVKVMGYVFDLEGLKPAEKFVLVAYADHADHKGENIYPSIKTIAKKTGYDRRTVQRITRKLEKLEVLIKNGTGKGGRSNTTNYSINMGLKGDSLTPFEDDEKGDSLTERATLDPLKGDSVPPEPSLTVQEPSLSESCENSPNINDLTEDDFETIEEYFAWRLQFNPEPIERQELTEEDYRKSIDASVMNGLVTYGSEPDVADFPEHVRHVIAEVCKLWSLVPPKTKSRKADWISDAEELINSCAGLNTLDVIRAIRSDHKWHMEKNNGVAPFTVCRPGSLVKAVSGKAGEMRQAPVQDQFGTASEVWHGNVRIR
jgi:hypothetical protein